MNDHSGRDETWRLWRNKTIQDSLPISKDWHSRAGASAGPADDVEPDLDDLLVVSALRASWR
jgi:hypothetical protein